MPEQFREPIELDFPTGATVADAKHAPLPTPSTIAEKNAGSKSYALMTSPRAVMEFGCLQEFQALNHEELIVFRQTLNCSYRTCLFFRPKTLAYYITFHRSECVGRVVMTLDFPSAEITYEHFCKQSARLSEHEIRQAQLTAETALAAQLAVDAQLEAHRIESDLNAAHLHQLETLRHQSDLRRQTAIQETAHAAAHAHLKRIQHRLQQLRLASHEGLPRRSHHLGKSESPVGSDSTNQ